MTPTISHLIRSSGLSYRQVAEASGLSKARIGQMAAGRRLSQMPPRATIEGLATALSTTPDEVEAAIQESLGQPERITVTLARRIAALAPRDQRVVEAVLRALEEGGR